MRANNTFSFRNLILRRLCRLYPFQKGRFRTMMLLEKMLERREQLIDDLFGKYKILLNLNHHDLESSFYYFIPERYEHETQRYIKEVVGENMLTMDVGAHLGLFTILLADRVGPNGKVYSFEPATRNYDRLTLNLNLNQLPQVVPIKMGLSQASGRARLILNERSSAGDFLEEVSIRNNAALSPAVLTEEVQTITLDQFVNEHQIGKIDLIKIDAERSEDLILEGAKKTLSSGIAVRIICEINSSHSKVTVGQDRVRNVFYAYGYRSYILNTMLSHRKYLSELKPNEPVVGLQNLLFQK